MGRIALGIALILGLSAQVSAQMVADTAPPIQQKVRDGKVMMTVFIRHDQSKKS
jgi:hypothetical protein